jgi:hypothetical protein
MPAVSFYLKKDVLESIRARSKSQSIPVSQIISKAVEIYLQTNEANEARKRLLVHLQKGNWLGDWEELHRERSLADADRN